MSMRQVAVTGLCGVALVAAVVVAPSVSASDVLVPQGTVAAGSLDPSFAGGAGYRAVPNPTTVLNGKRSGVGLLVTSGGAVRTIATYPTLKDGGVLYGSMLMRGWTASGWLDRSFYSGKTKTLVKYIDPVDGPALESTGMATNSTMSLSMMGYSGRSFTRLQADGRTIASARPPGREEDNIPASVDFLPSGAPVVCWTMADDSTRLQLFDAGLVPVGFRDGVALPGTCWDLVIEGSHLWYMGTGPANAEGVHTVGIARTDLAFNPDPAWGQDGYVEVQLPFAPSSGGYSSALLGMPDGGAYVYRSQWNEGDVSIAKLTSSGDLNTAFGTEGVVRLGGTSCLLKGREIWVNATVADAKGVVLSVRVRDLAGTEPWRYRLIRLTPDGDLDPLFGKAGIVTTSQETTSLAIDGQGRILTLSTVSSGSVYLARRLS